MKMRELREKAFRIDPKRTMALEDLWEDGSIGNKDLVWGLEDIIDTGVEE